MAANLRVSDRRSKAFLNGDSDLYRRLATSFLAAFDAWKGRRVIAYNGFLEKTQWMKREELRKLQLKRLKALLKHAYENVPYYHASFKNVNFHPNDLNSLNDLKRVPVLKKSHIRERLDSLSARNMPKRERIRRFTTGTTASPVKFFRGRKDISWGIAAELRGYGWAGYKVGDKLGFIFNVRPSIAESSTFKIENILRRCKFLNVRYLSEASIKPYAESLFRFQPSFVQGHCGATSIFAAFLSQNENLKIHPKAVFTSCQTLLPHYREIIEGAFGCSVYDYYAAAEVSHIAAQCGQHEGLHVFEENILLEMVEDGESVSLGEEGRVLVTNLHSYVMPFIRYEIGDVATGLGSDCGCGRELSLIKVMGRTDQYFVNSDGSFMFLKDFERFFEDIPIRDFQVIQESLDELVIRIAPLPGYSQVHSDFIVKNIQYVGHAKIRVELVDSILPGKSGKIRHLVSKIATNYT